MAGIGNFEILLDEQVFCDVLEAERWYDTQKPGLGKTFISAYRKTMDTLQKQPHIYARVKGDYRKAFIPKFPYFLIYKALDEREEVWIHGVFHSKQSPDKWALRISEMD